MKKTYHPDFSNKPKLIKSWSQCVYFPCLPLQFQYSNSPLLNNLGKKFSKEEHPGSLLLFHKICRKRVGFRAYLFWIGFNLSFKCYQINRMRNGLNFVLGNEWEKYIFGHVTSMGHRKIYESLSRNGILIRPPCSSTKPLAHHNESRRIHIEVRNKDPQIHFKQLQKVHERAWPQLLLVNLIYMWNTREKRLRSMSKVWSHAHSVSSIFCLVLKPACENVFSHFRALHVLEAWRWFVIEPEQGGILTLGLWSPA